MTQDAADKAHEDKVEATADGERLVAHSTFTEGDRELRTLMDEAEAERVAGYQEAGYVGSPLSGDYHAARRAAKQGGAIVAGVGGGTVDDPSAAVVDQIREAMVQENQAAGAARRAAGQRRGSGPQSRRSRADVVQEGASSTGQTGGLRPGAAEGVGKSASSTGTDTTDRGMDASVGSAPANPDPGTKNTPQDRPDSQAASTGGNVTGGKGGSAKPPTKTGTKAN
jgi:hypothetical protein